ncbi:hypothetical protein PENSPDRAFT_685548 [Peniophora sp. CONT]|nr:hypothetical protein PENSPDRAFT_685548 [Peniophora sp. CONT]
MPPLMQTTFPQTHDHSIPGDDELIPPFRACDFNLPSPRTLARMLELEPVLQVDGEETGSASSDSDADDQSEQAVDTPCTSQASSCADEDDADPQTEAGADARDEPTGIDKAWGSTGLQAFLSGDSLDPFLQATPDASYDLSGVFHSIPHSAPPALPDFDIFGFQPSALAQPTAGPSSMPYNFHHGYPSDVSHPNPNPIAAPPLLDADTLGFPSDPYANVNMLDLGLPHNQMPEQVPFDDHLSYCDFGDAWQTSGVLPQPQDFVPALQLQQPYPDAAGSSAVPAPIFEHSLPAGIVAPRPQRAWDTPAVLNDAAFGDLNHPDVSAPVHGQLPSSLDGTHSQHMVWYARTEMHMTHAQTQMSVTSTQREVSQAMHQMSQQYCSTQRTGYAAPAPPGPRRTHPQRQYARLGQEPYRNQYYSRRRSVDALLNRLHPEQLAVLEHVATNMANSQVHAQM